MSCVAILKENGLKLTVQRRLIPDIVHKSCGHMTGEEIIRIVRSRMPCVNKSTVYRTLELLEKLECVCEPYKGYYYFFAYIVQLVAYTSGSTS